MLRIPPVPAVGQISPLRMGLRLSQLALLVSFVGLTGCSQPVTGSAASSSTEDSDIARVKSAFGLLETIAGKGKRDAGNDWQTRFEGGPAAEAELSRPHMALADAEGNIYIADKEAHAIRRVALDGTITTVAGTNSPGDGVDTQQLATEVALRNPNGLWVQPDGTFYLVDLDNAKIRKVTPDGMMRTVFQVKKAKTPVGRGIWVSPDGNEALVCAGSELLRWKAAAGTQVHASGFSELGMVVRDAEGRIWVGDRGGNRVYEIRNGEKIVRAGNGLASAFVNGRPALETSFAGARAVWPYGRGFFVGLHEGSRVVYVDENGLAHTFLDGAHNAHGGDGKAFHDSGNKVSEVRSVAASPQGDLIVVENDSGFVRVVRAVRP
ncbi:hypothetical protein ACFL5O_09055 [Myxococcota bacterium]